MTLYRDHFQNYKGYHVPKAQLIIADIPYNIGVNAYASNPQWYIDGDLANGQSELAGKKFFQTDDNFNSAEYMHFCNKLLKPEPKETGKAPCMIIFCSFEQQFGLIELGKKHGLPNYINLVFRKNYSPQVLKANMRVVGNAEYALLFYREKLPKFNNEGRMIFNVMDWERDGKDVPSFHPTQKPLKVLESLIKIFTDPGDVIVDPVAGSGSTIVAAENLGRKAYGFEIDRKFYKLAIDWIERERVSREQIAKYGFSNSKLKELNPNQQLLFADCV